MDKVNSKLYLENYYIMQENERLRRKAELLNVENMALLNELRQRLERAGQPMPEFQLSQQRAAAIAAAAAAERAQVAERAAAAASAAAGPSSSSSPVSRAGKKARK